MLILLLLSLLPGTSFAADDTEDGQKLVYRNKIEIDFEELEIEGILLKPQTSLVIERKKASFNPLIKLRNNWDQEISESTEEIK